MDPSSTDRKLYCLQSRELGQPDESRLVWQKRYALVTENGPLRALLTVSSSNVGLSDGGTSTPAIQNCHYFLIPRFRIDHVEEELLPGCQRLDAEGMCLNSLQIFNYN
jgi:hypothetical protein